MKKVKLQFDKCVKKKVDWNGQKFEIQPLVDNKNKLYIYNEIERCFNERIKEQEDNIPLNLGLSADLDMLICALQTNVNLDDVSYDDMVTSGFVSFVKSNINNYNEIKQNVDSLIIVLVIKSLLPDLSNFLTEFDIMGGIKDKSPEEIQKMLEVLEATNIFK